MSPPKAATLAMLPFFPRDYLAATRGMTLAERGAYTDLLFFSWDMGSLPNDPKILARMLGVGADEFMEIWTVIRPKFVMNDSGAIVNSRLEHERLKSVELKSKASEKAKVAAGASWEKRRARSNAPSNASSINSIAPPPQNMLGAMLEQCPPSPSPSPSPSAPSSPAKELGGGAGEPLRNGASVKQEPKEIRFAKALTLIRATPDLPLAQVATMFHLTPQEKREFSRMRKGRTKNGHRANA